MALPPGLANEVFTYALGKARQQAAKQSGSASVSIDPKPIAADAYRLYKLKPSGDSYYNISEFRTIAEAAVDTYVAGRNSDDSPGTPAPASSLGRDVTIGPTDQEYRYRVVLVIDDGMGHRYETLHIVDSPVPLSPDELWADGQQAVFSGEVRSGPPTERRGDARVVEIHIVSAGKRG